MLNSTEFKALIKKRIAELDRLRSLCEDTADDIQLVWMDIDDDEEIEYLLDHTRDFFTVLAAELEDQTELLMSRLNDFKGTEWNDDGEVEK